MTLKARGDIEVEKSSNKTHLNVCYNLKRNQGPIANILDSVGTEHLSKRRRECG